MGRHRTQVLFVGDPLINNGTQSSYSLYSDILLRKASNIECELIKDKMQHYFSGEIYEKDFNPYEADYVVKQNEISKDISYKPRDKENWYYWVIETKNTSLKLVNYLPLAELDISILCLYNYPSDITDIMDFKGEIVTTMYPNHIDTYIFYKNLRYLNFRPKYVNDLLVDNANEVLLLVDAFNKQSKEFNTVRKALQDFLMLNQIPLDNPFRILNYFSIIEYLITSKGNSSITHQLKTKISLLNNRMSNKINTSKYFKGDQKLDKIISVLYDIRSSIAHGSYSSLHKSKIHTNGVEKDTINDFIYYELVKKLILHALKEPHLIEDLKKC